jgi:hypothetical protein
MIALDGQLLHVERHAGLSKFREHRLEQRPDRVHAFERPVWREEDHIRSIVRQDALEGRTRKSI